MPIRKYAKMLQNVDQLGKITSDMKSATDNFADKSARFFGMQRMVSLTKKPKKPISNKKEQNNVNNVQ